MKTINERLIDLYSGHWDELKSQAVIAFEDDEIKPACPLLLQVNEDEYSKSDIKIMYCGQETRGWGTANLISCDMKSVLDIYQNFFLNKGYERHPNRGFFQKVRKFDAFFKQQFEDKKIVSIWNNVSKIGKDKRKTGVTDKIRNLERTYFPVLKREFEILKPDIVIFMTGTRDYDIRFHFPDVKIERVIESMERTQKQLASVRSESIAKVAIRTYHPASRGYFNKAMMSDIEELLKTLINNHQLGEKK